MIIKKYPIYVILTFFTIFSMVIIVSKVYAVQEIWSEYENLKDLVKDIRNGAKNDDNIDYDKFRESSVYKNENKTTRDCVDLAHKVGGKLGDYEIVRCYKDAYYFKEKYINAKLSENTSQPQKARLDQEQVKPINDYDKILTETKASQENQVNIEQSITNGQNHNVTKGTEENLKQSSVSSDNGCDSSYPDICITPSTNELTCADIPYRNFKVVLPDPHGFDSDRDGIGCEG